GSVARVGDGDDVCLYHPLAHDLLVEVKYRRRNGHRGGSGHAISGQGRGEVRGGVVVVSNREGDAAALRPRGCRRKEDIHIAASFRLEGYTAALVVSTRRRKLTGGAGSHNGVHSGQRPERE